MFEQIGTVLPEARIERTLRKLEHLQKEAARYRSIEQRMDETGETQVSLSDPDARAGICSETRLVFHAGSPAVPDCPNEARCILALSRSHYTSKDPARKIKIRILRGIKSPLYGATIAYCLILHKRM